ncbi:MAG: agmatinase [Acidobacteriota bacterium]
MSPSGSIVPFAGCLTDDPSASSRCVLLGIPDDSQSSFRRGCAGAPERIRLAYDGRCFNATTETGVDLTKAVFDGGDLEPADSWEASALAYQTVLESLLMENKTPFVAGGDHAVTIPLVEGLRVLNRPVHVVQVDAHPDLYPQFEGNPHSHACVAARVMEMKHVASLTQLGIRALNPEQSGVLERFRHRIHVHLARDLQAELPEMQHIPQGAPVYLTVDMDGFDPAYAPGVSHPVPGGLSARQVLNFIQRGHWELVGMDVVEVNPTLDVNERTAVLAARLLHEGMGQVVPGT